MENNQIIQEKQKAVKNFEDAVISLVLTKRFYFEILSRLTRAYSDRTRSLGIVFRDGNPGLLINPVFFNTLDAEDRTWYLEHEVLHLLFKHPLRARGRDQKIFSLACDLAVNQLIEPVSRFAVLPEHIFGGGAVERKREAEYYYAQLSEKEWEMEGSEPLDDHGLWDGSDSSAAGGERPGSGSAHEDAVNSLVKASFQSSGARIPGSISGHFKIEIYDADARYKISWQKILRQYVSHAMHRSSISDVEIKPTRKRPSKKLGFPFPSLRVHPRTTHTVAVVVDTSGSISVATFNVFMGEISSMCSRDIQFNLLFCDSEVCTMGEPAAEDLNSPDNTLHYRDGVFYAYNPVMQKDIARAFNSGRLTGGGGTSYVPAIEKIRRMRPLPDCVIYFTDSLDDGTLEEPGLPVLFVLTAQRKDFYPWARAVLMEDL